MKALRRRRRRRLALKGLCERTGKRRYANKLDAITALATACRSHRVQRAYFCGECKCWHLSSMRKVNP